MTSTSKSDRAAQTNYRPPSLGSVPGPVSNAQIENACQGLSSALDELEKSVSELNTRLDSICEPEAEVNQGEDRVSCYTVPLARRLEGLTGRVRLQCLVLGHLRTRVSL